MRLYIAMSASDGTRYCTGSSLCMRIIQHLPLGTIQVLDCATVRPTPSWLVGTPTLDAGDELYRGEDAVMKMVQLVAQQHSHDKRAKTVQPQKTAPLRNDAEGLDDLWTEPSRPPDGEDDDDELNSGRKLTGDDLSRAVRQQDNARAQPAASAPPSAVASLLEQEHD